jgi:hypothetical protein
LVIKQDVRISEHGYDELANNDLTVIEIIEGIHYAQLIESYPNYPKGESILLLQRDGQGKPVHVVWGIPKGHEKPAVLVTAYRPSLSRWNESFTSRKQK